MHLPSTCSSRLGRFAGLALLALCAACGGAREQWAPPADWAIDPASIRVFRASNDATRAARLSPDELGALMNRAHVLIDDGEFAQAAELFDVIARGLPNWYAYRPAYIQALWRGRGDLEGALAQADRCLVLDPESLDCFALRGILLAESGEEGDAIEILLEIVDEPSVSDEVLRLRLGKMLLRNERVAEAVDVLRPLAQQDLLSVLDRLAFARAAESVGAVEDAASAYEWVRHHHIDWVRGAAFLRDFLTRQGRTREADRLQREMDREIERRNPSRPMRRL